MNMLFSLLKLTVWTVAVLLLSQIQINGKRICDHVGEITHSSAVQKPVNVLSQHFDFTDGKIKILGNGTQGTVTKNQNSEKSE